MSLHLAAQHLASKGRGPDTQLVHMTKGEVAGLNALAKAHGGSLTLNPETGLPEAGFLSSILPMAAGAALAATGVGAPMAAMLVGGGMTLATGSLQKGLMAGLGAFGGAGLGAGLMEAGAAGLGEAGAASLGEMAPQTAAQLGTGFEANMAAQGALPTAGATGASMGAQTAAQLGNSFQADLAAQGINPVSIQPQEAIMQAAPQTVTQMAPPTFSDNLAQMGRGVGALGTEQGRNAFIGNAASKGVEEAGVGGYGGLAKYGLAALAPSMLQQRQQGATYQDNSPNPYRYRFEWARPSGPNTVNSSEVSQLVGRYTPYADGGLTSTDFAAGGDTDVARGMSGQSADAMRYLMGQTSQSPSAAAAQQMVQTQPAPTPTPTPVAAGKGAKPVAYSPFYTLLNLATQNAGLGKGTTDTAGSAAVTPQYTWNQATHTFTPVPTTAKPASAVQAPLFTPEPVVQYAQGGISHLGGYSDGGRMLRGPGDGVSDSIPATIGGSQPARLADGEFVVPARIVSELGNGSSEAGARKLYAMMDRVQKARAKTTGKNRVAVNSRADKALPA